MEIRFSSIKIGIIICSLAVFAAGCTNHKKDDPLFEAREATYTGLQFTNTLTPDSAFNMFKYMYFYNGAGIGAADFNGDGNTDIFFSSNQGQNTLYLGNGDLTFTDVTQQAGIPNDGGWSTGVSVADVNNDGLNDIYICRVGNFETLQSKNQLLICTGVDAKNIPHFTDSAAAYGLDFSGFSTQAVFFDYDLDGDLDMYLMNHAVHHSGMFAERARFLGTYSQLSGDRFYKNDNSKYVDATKETGIKIVTKNRKASHEYFLEDTFQAGIVLTGAEIKSIRNNQINLKDGFVQEKDGELWLHNVHISPYTMTNKAYNHEAKRTRKLLLHRDEIRKLIGQVEQKGLTLVPLKMYLKRGWLKVTIALVRGKKLHDKREDLKRKQEKREIERAVKNY